MTTDLKQARYFLNEEKDEGFTPEQIKELKGFGLKVTGKSQNVFTKKIDAYWKVPVVLEAGILHTTKEYFVNVSMGDSRNEGYIELSVNTTKNYKQFIRYIESALDKVKK